MIRPSAIRSALRAHLAMRAAVVTLATLAAVVTLAAGAPRPCAAQTPAPADRQALVLLRALGYDGALTRAGDSVVIGVLARSAPSPADPTAAAIVTAFGKLTHFRVLGLPLRVVRLAYTNKAQLAVDIQRAGVDALYVCPDVESDLHPVLELTRERKVLSMASRHAHIHSGVAVGVFVVEGRATLFVNLTAARAEGAKFGSDMLRIATVIR